MTAFAASKREIHSSLHSEPIPWPETSAIKKFFTLVHYAVACGVFGPVELIFKEPAVLKRHGVTSFETANSP